MQSFPLIFTTTFSYSWYWIRLTNVSVLLISALLNALSKNLWRKLTSLLSVAICLMALNLQLDGGNGRLWLKWYIKMTTDSLITNTYLHYSETIKQNICVVSSLHHHWIKFIHDMNNMLYFSMYQMVLFHIILANNRYLRPWVQ